MKKNFLLTMAMAISTLAIFAQNKSYVPAIPAYKDSLLVKVIKSQYYRLNKEETEFVRQNASPSAFRDTIISIFSQFATGNNVYAKNANQLLAEIATKETKLSYNAAIYWKELKGIYNVELFASGKDNLASIFGKGKYKGNFGINLSGSYLGWSTLSYKTKVADTVHNARLDYGWALEEKAVRMTGGSQKSLVTTEITNLEKILDGRTQLPSTSTKEEVLAKLTKLRDSLKKFVPSSEKEKYYKQELTKYDKKFARWTGFNLLTFDWKAGLSSEGFNYYKMISTPVVYPVINENGKRFTRWSLGGATNIIHNGPVFSSKATFGATIGNFIGFDGQTPDEFQQSTSYDSVNVNRSIEKKYSAYAYSDDNIKTYQGTIISLSHQMLFGKRKLFGFGFSCARSDFFNGVYKGKVGIDNTYSLLFALSKKDDVLNKNVLAISLKTPDIRADLPKSFDQKTGERLRMRDKLEIGLTFGLTIDKLLGK